MSANPADAVTPITPDPAAPAPEAPATPPAAPAFIDTVPADYRDKPYMKGVTDINGVLKQLDGAQSLIGATKVPGTDATPEQWNSFYSKLGRPEAPDGYGLNTAAEGVVIPEHSKAFNAALEKSFHEAGVTKTQAEAITKSFIENSKALTEAQKTILTDKANSEFNAAADRILGADKDSALDVSNSLLAEYAPEGVKEKLESLDPETRLTFAAVIKGISDKYISADDITSIKGGVASNSLVTEGDLTTALREAMSAKEFTDPMTPSVVQAKAVAKVNDLTNKLMKVRADNKK